MRLLSLIFFSILSVISLEGKEQAILWDKTYTNQQQINDIVLLPDGQLVAVGARRNKKNKNEGILLFLDPISGEIDQTIVFPKSAWNSEFKSIAQADDGSFYLVGYTEMSKRKQKGWILQVDEFGEKIRELEIGEGDSELTNIVWLDNNTGLIAGYKHKNKKGRVWLLNVKEGIITKNKEVGAGGYKDIKGMVANADGSVWISGNTTKVLKKGNVWLLKTNANFDAAYTQLIDGKKWQEVSSVSGDFFGNVLLSGNSKDEDNQTWLAEINEKGYQLTPLSTENNKHYLAGYAYKAPNGINWMSTYEQPEVMDSKWLNPHLTTFKGELLESSPLVIPKKEQFRIIRILRNYQGNYLLAGNMLTTNEFRLIAIKQKEKIVSKAIPRLRNTKPTFYFADTDKSSCLSPKERGYIEFTLTNIGTSNFIDGIVSLEEEQGLEGLDFQKKVFIPFIPVGKDLRIKLKVVGKANLVAGSAKVNITVAKEEKILLSFSKEIESIVCQKGQTISASWEEPDVMNIGSRVIRTKNSFQKIALDIQATPSHILKAEDPKVYKNGILLADEKNGERMLSNPMKEGLNLAYRFNYTIRQLEKGKNVIYVKINEYQTDSITVYYEPRKPYLHVLAIGPTYNNLKYTAKDARDFVHAVTENINTNFFEKIYIDTLLTEERTQTNDIRRAFEKLKNQYDEQNRIDRIDRDDYLMVFISGHGIKHKGQFRLVSSDFDSDYIETTTVNYERDIIGFLNQIDCKKIAFVDACLSGGITGAKHMKEEDLSNALLIANKSAPGLAAFASCSDEEQSFENKVWQNGVFTEAILEAIEGEPIRLNDGNLLTINQDEQNGKEVISIGEMYQFLQKRVPDLLKGLKLGLTQNPILSNRELDMNLPLFILK